MILIIVALILAIYLYGRRTFNYWEVRNIKHDKPIFLVGTNLKNYLLQQNITQQAENVYWKYPNEKVVGFYRGWRPELVIRDPEIVKCILTSDFSYFNNRGLNQHEKVETLLQSLFFVEGDLWRLLRQRSTAAFTTSKLKSMFPLLEKCTEQLKVRITSKSINYVSVVDARDLMARFTTDFICASGFNIETDALKNDNSEFRKLGKRIFTSYLRDLAVIVLKDLLPEISSKFSTFDSSIEENFNSLIRNIIKIKTQTPSDRKDFIDLLMECNQKGPMIGDSIEKLKPDGTPEVVTKVMDEKLMAAQAFIFFAAGFETSASATSFALHELAYNPLVQQKVQDDIDRVLLKHNNKLTYDAIKEMTYLECTLKESLRMFPPLGFISRKCTSQYTFPELNLKIDKGVAVIIPVKALQNDPLYFEKPEEFRPERFLSQEFEIKNKYIFLPFGEGPRSCIGRLV
ncbi:unnamed protein product [Parnassius apollo]|uniref:unspecific monooxygenase n=1 Tax=Parnassius apollo TaxID=110799 RepID=A0A8S3W7K1_PARAO|nr:unnamed protein product [Parnassius apollo]